MKYLKDPVSGLTHLFGALLSIAGLVFLILSAVYYGEGAWDVVSFTIFGVGLILLYSASSIYHLFNWGYRTNIFFRKIDHIMIYVLIAATYTPMALGPLRGGLGWTIFGIEWGLTILGILLTIFWFDASRWLTTGIYIGMGWAVVISSYQLIKIFSEANYFYALSWLLLGGIFYTIGGVMYAMKKPDIQTRYFGFHELFHIFVILGSLCHYWFIAGCLVNV